MKDFWRSTQSSIIRRFSTLRLVYVFFSFHLLRLFYPHVWKVQFYSQQFVVQMPKMLNVPSSKVRPEEPHVAHGTWGAHFATIEEETHTSQGTHATSWRAHFFCFGRVKDFDRVQFRWTRRGGLITKWAQPPTVRGIALQNTAMPHGDVWPLVGIGNSLLWGYPIKCWPYNKW